MKNIFGTNSRFAALAEDIATNKQQQKNDKKKEEENKPDNSYRKGFNNNRRGHNRLSNKEINEAIEHRAFQDKLRKESNEKKEAERVKKMLCIDNFPRLCETESETESESETNNGSFLAKIKNSIENENDKNQKETTIPPGWVVLTKNKTTGKINFEFKKKTINNTSDKQLAYDGLYKLCDLHKRRTNEYIELYGYDNWEKTFKTPNWIEDEEYEEKMEEEYYAQMEMESDEESEDYTTENVKYWERY